MKMYRTSFYGDEIEEVKVYRVSNKSVWVYSAFFRKEMRENIITNSHRYWDEFEQAKRFLKERYSYLVKDYEYKIKEAKKSLSKIENY